MEERRMIHIDEFFRREMEDQAEAPPTAVWDALELRLDGQKRKRRFPIWWFWTIGGLLVISAAGLIAGYNQPTGQQPLAQYKATPEKHIAHATNTRGNNENLSGHTVQAHTPATVPNATTKNIHSSTTANDNKTTQPPVTIPQLNNNTTGHVATTNNEATKTTAPGPITALIDHGNASYSLKPGVIKAIPVTLIAPVIAALPTTDIDAMEQEDAGSTTNEQPGVQAGIAGTTGAPLPVIAEKAVTPADNTVVDMRGTDLLATTNPMGLPPSTWNDRVTDNKLDEGTAFAALLSSPSLWESYTDTSKKKNGNLLTDTVNLLDAVTPMPAGVVQKNKWKLPVEAGIKVGMSRGTDRAWNANKFIIGPYVEAVLPSGFSVIIQPTVQTGGVKTGVFDGQQSYYEITGSEFNSDTRVERGKVDGSILTPNPPDTVFRTYYYRQNYDSVHISYKAGQRTQTDVELPVMLRYKVTKNLAVMGGVSATYSSVVSTETVEERYKGLSKEHTENITPETFYVTTQGQEPPDGPAPKAHSDLFKYNQGPFSSYAPRTISTGSSFFRYGFMLGASATLRDRWTIDLMMHKTGVNMNVIQDKQLQKIYTQPYFRLMIGYKLVK